ncbi:glycosyltransferase family 4 protein [Sphingomonas sp.]|uniref:glycosyltransferase family 4 protein n=1 Tax=Sphingomonas sp. TaxID=28214 RepID=UPI002FCAA348
MRVGLNATCFNERPSGAKQRFTGIYRALIERCRDIEFVIYEPRDCRVGEWFAGAPNVSVRRTPLPSSGRFRRGLGGLPYWRLALGRDRLDLFETFHLPLVRAPNCPTILTVHDARPVRREVPLVKRLLYGRVLRQALRRADHVITVSETMKQEIAEIEPSATVTTIYNGIDPGPFAAANGDAEALRARHRLPPEFILAVGHLEARKNYVGLVQAVAELRRAGKTISLVIVGNDGGEREEIRRETLRLGITDQVMILEGVSDLELQSLYALCTLVAFPSFYEGFGIPVLEAMAARRPLVLSDTPVFRELTEGRGAYFPPEDSGAIAAAIAAVLDSPQRQQELVAYGVERIRAFEFARLAGQVEQLYRLLQPQAIKV